MQGVLVVVVQVVDDIGVVRCAVPGVGLVADGVVEAHVEEMCLDPGYAPGGGYGSLGDVVVGDGGLGEDGHGGGEEQRDLVLRFLDTG